MGGPFPCSAVLSGDQGKSLLVSAFLPSPGPPDMNPEDLGLQKSLRKTESKQAR